MEAACCIRLAAHGPSVLTPLPNVISWTPILFATSAIDLARIEDEANGLILVLLGEASACRHANPSAGTQRQSTTECLQDRELSNPELRYSPPASPSGNLVWLALR